MGVAQESADAVRVAWDGPYAAGRRLPRESSTAVESPQPGEEFGTW